MSFRIKIACALAALACAFFASLFFGRYGLDPATTIQALFSWLPFVDEPESSTAQLIVWNVRMPRIIVAMLVGAGLSAAGAAYQGVFKNPLVSPDLLGVSAAAGFGAALSILLVGAASNLTVVLSFTCGLLGVGMTCFLGRTKGGSSTTMLVLGGIVVTALFNAGISMTKYLADPEDVLPSITFWLMGSLSSIGWSDVYLCAPVILVCLAVLMAVSWRINALAMGERQAQSLGVNVRRLRAIIIVASTLISSVSICVCGTIGWVGLVIPHIARMVFGPDYHKMMPATMTIGAIFLLIIDDVSRCATEASLPLSILTALIGAPVFAVLIRRTQRGA